jgi:hypothetical protein
LQEFKDKMMPLILKKRVHTTAALLVAALALTFSATSARAKAKPAPPASNQTVPSQNSEASGSVHIPPEALKRQIKQLERARHILELSAGNDRASHSAVAARHLQVAINELNMELKEKAKGPAAGPSARPSPSGGSSPPKRAGSPPVSQK